MVTKEPLSENTNSGLNLPISMSDAILKVQLKSVKQDDIQPRKIGMVKKNHVKVHIFRKGHKILQNLHLTFDWHYIGQKTSQNFVAFSEFMNFKSSLLVFFSKIILTFCENIFEIIRTINSKSERSEQFLKQNAFNLFLGGSQN